MNQTPRINEFNPRLIKHQIDTIKLVRKDFDYSQGALELLLSGSVGSAKSILVAHLAATHALKFSGAGVLLGRRTLKDLKNTLWTTLLRHCPYFEQFLNKAEMTIKLPNGSTIYGVSWDDGRYDKFRSYELSFVAIEELTENRDAEIYNELKMRLGRCSGVRENIAICPTNPDSPSHWAYEYFIEKPSETRQVIYSKTINNPFLPPWYIKQLKSDLDPKMAQRMIEGLWVEIYKDQVYYNYSDDNNYIDQKYKYDPDYPICICHDFNIGKGKPMSAIAAQFIDNKFHFGDSYLVEGARTGDIMEEMASAGIFDLYNNHIYVYGDASGKNNDTRSNADDYQIIENFLVNYKRKDGGNLEVMMNVPKKNPPIRRRQNVVNAHFINDNNEVRLFIYAGAKDLAKGFRLTEFKSGGSLIENDTLREQHVTTAAGYFIDYEKNRNQNNQSRTIQL